MEQVNKEILGMWKNKAFQVIDSFSKMGDDSSNRKSFRGKLGIIKSRLQDIVNGNSRDDNNDSMEILSDLLIDTSWGLSEPIHLAFFLFIGMNVSPKTFISYCRAIKNNIYSMK
ncbi:MAG: hypothetical protein AABY32_01655 [Nanoarchaeota archaeon]|mgnify:CR=1 FL=1